MSLYSESFAYFMEDVYNSKEENGLTPYKEIVLNSFKENLKAYYKGWDETTKNISSILDDECFREKIASFVSSLLNLINNPEVKFVHKVLSDIRMKRDIQKGRLRNKETYLVKLSPKITRYVEAFNNKLNSY